MPNQTARRSSLRGWVAYLGLASAVTVSYVSESAIGSELRRSAVVRAVQRARSSVVNIRGEKTLSPTAVEPGSDDTGRLVNGMGTGVIIDPRGYVLTNYHVVDGVREIQVTLASGHRVQARLLARDLDTDLAVIKIDVSVELPVITIGTSSDLMPGETVVAVGNAYGYTHTVTQGIISALKRAVQVSDAQYYDDLIQTDASINPGNSGGPLLNIDGEMIGINVAVRAGAQGIGFAIPVNKALAIAADLMASRQIQSAWHGVVLAGDENGLDGELTVVSVEKGSPAEGSGLKAGDRITRVGSLQTKRGLDFHRGTVDLKAGEKVEVTVQRGGVPLDLQLTLADQPRRNRQVSRSAWDVLGLELKPVPTKQFQQKHRSRYRGGLAVTAVRAGSPANSTGIRRGDVLVGMHVWETVTLDNVSYILKRSDLNRITPVKFYVLRGNETLFGYLSLTPKTAQRPRG